MLKIGSQPFCFCLLLDSFQNKIYFFNFFTFSPAAETPGEKGFPQKLDFQMSKGKVNMG